MKQSKHPARSPRSISPVSPLQTPRSAALWVRSNVRGEDVRIYRLRMTPANARVLLREYVEEVDDLARAPRFYNTLTSNCTNLNCTSRRAVSSIPSR